MKTFGDLDKGDKIYVLHNPKVFAPDHWLEVWVINWVERNVNKEKLFVYHCYKETTNENCTLALDWSEIKLHNLSFNNDGIIRRFISDPDELKKNINWMADDYIKHREIEIRNCKMDIRKSRKLIRSCNNVKRKFKI